MKREKDFASGLIVPGDLPDRKKQREGFRKWSYFSRWPAQWRIKREKDFASGLIVPGDLPDKKKQREGFRKWSHFSRWPARWRIKHEKYIVVPSFQASWQITLFIEINLWYFNFTF
jgi:hypothetical protein